MKSKGDGVLEIKIQQENVKSIQAESQNMKWDAADFKQKSKNA